MQMAKIFVTGAADAWPPHAGVACYERRAGGAHLGCIWHHQARRKALPAVTDVPFQDALLEALARHTGVQLP
jgi:hypothetical protein